MEPKHRALPIGFRFRPTDCEMSNYFLKKKVFGQTMEARTIPEECNDIFSKHPRDLPGYPREQHWYYYCRKLNKKGTTNSNNIWTLIGEETNVLDRKNNGELVGIKRSFTLVKHQEEESGNTSLSDEEEESLKYNWFMDEISLPLVIIETDWILCHVFGKKSVDLSIIESESECEEEEKSVVTESLDFVREKDGSVHPPSPFSP